MRLLYGRIEKMQGMYILIEAREKKVAARFLRDKMRATRKVAVLMACCGAGRAGFFSG